MLKTIVVPLDDSEGARRILPFVAALASPERTAVTLVYVIGDAGLRDHATAVLDRAREQLAGGVQVRCLVYEGATAPTIIQTAQALRADLIAMTTDHETGLDRWLNGSVADEVLRGRGPSTHRAQHFACAVDAAEVQVLVPLD